jgi:phospholipid/cholesterol/gamma-HCH transport system permease protein
MTTTEEVRPAAVVPAHLALHEEADGLHLVVTGDLLLAGAGGLYRELDRVDRDLAARPRGPLLINTIGIGLRDGAGAGLLARRCLRWRDAGWRVDLGGLDTTTARLLADETPDVELPPQTCPHPIVDWRQVTAGVTAALAAIGGAAHGLVSAYWHPARTDWRSVPILLRQAGADAVAIVVVINLLIGMIIGFQGVVQLGQFGVDVYVAKMVAVGHLRELGPLMTAVIIAGRSGAGYAAELGTMRVNEEIDALGTLNLDPWAWLGVPRLLALVIALPILTLIGDICGVIGGLIAAVPLSDITAAAYLRLSLEAVTQAHLWVGLTKTFAFAAAIVLVACTQGFAAHGGAAAVGRRTTRAVVLGILAVIVLNALWAVVTSLGGI